MTKAIETYYKGHHFRSRLEARWATVFDALQVKYLYEPEGYEFNGKKYLPDFYLTEQGVFVEIKPTLPNENYLSMLEEFSNEIGKSLLLISYSPGRRESENDIMLYCYDSTDSHGGVGWWNITHFLNDAFFTYDAINESRSFGHPNHKGYLDVFPFDKNKSISFTLFETACNIGKQARFEH